MLTINLIVQKIFAGLVFGGLSTALIRSIVLKDWVFVFLYITVFYLFFTFAKIMRLKQLEKRKDKISDNLDNVQKNLDRIQELKKKMKERKEDDKN